MTAETLLVMGLGALLGGLAAITLVGIGYGVAALLPRRDPDAETYAPRIELLDGLEMRDLPQ